MRQLQVLVSAEQGEEGRQAPRARHSPCSPERMDPNAQSLPPSPGLHGQAPGELEGQSELESGEEGKKSVKCHQSDLKWPHPLGPGEGHWTQACLLPTPGPHVCDQQALSLWYLSLADFLRWSLLGS